MLRQIRKWIQCSAAENRAHAERHLAEAELLASQAALVRVKKAAVFWQTCLDLYPGLLKVFKDLQTPASQTGPSP